MASPAHERSSGATVFYRRGAGLGYNDLHDCFAGILEPNPHIVLGVGIPRVSFVREDR